MSLGLGLLLKTICKGARTVTDPCKDVYKHILKGFAPAAGPFLVADCSHCWIAGFLAVLACCACVLCLLAVLASLCWQGWHSGRPGVEVVAQAGVKRVPRHIERQ